MNSAEDGSKDWSVFICYASEDRDAAGKVCQQLETAGFRCWIAPRDVRPGRDYPEEIIYGIEQSRSLVLILSTRANKSRFVRTEVERAYSKGKPVFPVRIEDVRPSRALELFISTKNWIDAWNGNLSRQHAERLMEELASRTDASLDGEISSELRRRVLTRKMLRIGGLVAAAALIAIVAAIVMRSAQDNAVEVVDTSHPVTAMFIGARIYPNRPFNVSYYLRDGMSPGGQNVGALDYLKAFEVYEAIAGPVFKRLYVGDPRQYKGVFDHTETMTFTLGHVPSIIIACLSYEIPDTRESRTSVQGFAFLPPDKLPAGTYAGLPPGVRLPFKDYGFAEVAGFRVYRAAKPDCRSRVEEYARGSMKSVLSAP